MQEGGRPGVISEKMAKGRGAENISENVSPGVVVPQKGQGSRGKDVETALGSLKRCGGLHCGPIKRGA